MSVTRKEAENFLKILINASEGFRQRAFKKALSSLKDYPDPVVIEDLGEGFGTGIKSRLYEISETGELKEVQEQAEKSKILESFQDVMGVGIVTALRWYEAGYRTLEDIKNNVSLTSMQKVGMEYVEDFKQKIPREEIDYYSSQIKKVVDCYNKEWNEIGRENQKFFPPVLEFIIAGSYRRGKERSGDIDCIIYNTVGDTNLYKKAGSPINDFLFYLRKMGILTNIIAKGTTKILAVVKDNRKTNPINRRIDFEITTKKSYPYALFYFTGSAEFNIRMRGKAKSMGYNLDQRTLTRLSTNEEIWLQDENAIMDFLGEPRKEPNER